MVFAIFLSTDEYVGIAILALECEMIGFRHILYPFDYVPRTLPTELPEIRAGLEPATTGIGALYQLSYLMMSEPDSNRRHSPLAMGEGFEPPDGFPPPVFKTGAINHSASPPYILRLFHCDDCIKKQLVDSYNDALANCVGIRIFT